MDKVAVKIFFGGLVAAAMLFMALFCRISTPVLMGSATFPSEIVMAPHRDIGHEKSFVAAEIKEKTSVSNIVNMVSEKIVDANGMRIAEDVARHLQAASLK